MAESAALLAPTHRFAPEVSFESARLRAASWASTTRRVPADSLNELLLSPDSPQPGDLVLARIDALGFHSALQLPCGRRRRLFVGDEIVVAYGNRYAPNQFEAVVPKTLGPCQLVASGGVSARVLSWHATLAKEATQITPFGLIARPDGRVANLRDYALPAVDEPPASRIPTIAVVGTSMDSGKTQTAAYTVKGLTLAGLRVGYAKVTGTGAGGDTWLLRDAGADPVLDFTDAGYASTYLLSRNEVRRAFLTLYAQLVAEGVEAIVLEIADGVLQCETAALLQTSEFHDLVGCILFAANDSMGAASGERWMAEHGLRVTALSGVLTSSPLSTREAAKATGLPIYSRQDLARPRTAMAILAAARRAGGNENGGAYMRWSTAQAAPVVAVPTMLESGAAE